MSTSQSEADQLAGVLVALLSEYGKGATSMPLGSRKRALWLMARDMLDDRKATNAAREQPPTVQAQVPQDGMAGLAHQQMQREFERTDRIVAGMAALNAKAADA